MPFTQDQLQQYRTDGFLIVRDLFTDAELQPVIDAIDEKVNALAERLYAENRKISDRFEQEKVFSRD